MINELEKLGVSSNDQYKSYFKLTKFIIESASPSKRELSVFFNNNIIKLSPLLNIDNYLELLNYQEQIIPGYMTLVSINQIFKTLQVGNKETNLSEKNANKIADFIMTNYKESEHIMKGILSPSNIDVLIKLNNVNRLSFIHDKIMPINLNLVIKKLEYLEDIKYFLKKYPEDFLKISDKKGLPLWKEVESKYDRNNVVKLKNPRTLFKDNENFTSAPYLYHIDSVLFINQMLYEWSIENNYKEENEQIQNKFIYLFQENVMNSMNNESLKNITQILSGFENRWLSRDNKGHTVLFNFLNNSSKKSPYLKNNYNDFADQLTGNFLSFFENILVKHPSIIEYHKEGIMLYHAFVKNTFNISILERLDKIKTFSELYKGKGLLHEGEFNGNAKRLEDFLKMYSVEEILGTPENQKIVNENLLNKNNIELLSKLFNNIDLTKVIPDLVTTMIVNEFYCQVVNYQDKDGSALEKLRTQIKNISFNSLPPREQLLKNEGNTVFKALGQRLKNSNALSDKYAQFIISTERELLNKSIVSISKNKNNQRI